MLPKVCKAIFQGIFLSPNTGRIAGDEIDEPFVRSELLYLIIWHPGGMGQGIPQLPELVEYIDNVFRRSKRATKLNSTEYVDLLEK